MTKRQQITKKQTEQLSLDLIEAQYALKNTRGTDQARGLLILVGGIEFAGKSEAIKQLREWVDPRHLYVKADIPNQITSKKLFWQPYVPFIPAHGQMMLLFGNWYTDLLASSLYGEEQISEQDFAEYIEQMHHFEQYLQANDIDVIKIWFDLSLATTQKRLERLDLAKALQRVPNFSWAKFPVSNWRNKKLYNDIQSIRKRFTSDWIIIDGEDEKLRNYQFAQEILAALKKPPQLKPQKIAYQAQDIHPQLNAPASTYLEKKAYKQQLKKLEKQLAEAMRYDPRNIVLLFEGMDAAGKGGAIKRIIKYLDPREYQIHSISAPERHERQRPYLWRFWDKLRDDSAINIFDRSWYGRVLVERVEHLISDQDWQRAYHEINRFEHNLSQHSAIVIKFWLSISKDEQLKRFENRLNTPQKYFKITDEDWRNREKWDQYLQAASDMLHYTSTEHAPWHVIASNDKYTARIQILQTILERLNAEGECPK
nr:phosphate--AMP phosphotransferase [Acinetobacter larvae]